MRRLVADILFGILGCMMIGAILATFAQTNRLAGWFLVGALVILIVYVLLKLWEAGEKLTRIWRHWR